MLKLAKPSNILLLDNFDSFTYNLVDQLKSKGHHLEIYRNALPLSQILAALEQLDHPILLLSPGPGTPEDSGCLLDLIAHCKNKVPILGICLGHQAIIQMYGGKIVRSSEIVHGRSSLITHDETAMFEGLPNPLQVARYHSLTGQDIPDSLIVNAYYNDICMAVRAKNEKVAGFQFHPESILTTQGAKLLDQTLAWLLE